MTDKTKTFSLLLAGTFLSSSVSAQPYFTPFTINNTRQTTTVRRAEYLPTLGSNGIYDVTEVSEPGENVFSLVNFDESGRPVVSYYKYAIKSGQTSHSAVNSRQDGRDINGNFFNLSSSNGAAITNRTQTVFRPWEIGNITGDFINNKANGNLANEPQGGAIYNRPLAGGQTTIGSITGDFIGNSASNNNLWTSFGGAIYNSTSAALQQATIGDITGNFIGNYVSAPRAHAYGGAIYNYGARGSTVSIGTISGSFIGNYVEGSTMAVGGAIYSSSDITIASRGKQIQFSGNYALTDGARENNAIFMDTGINETVLTFDVSEGGDILFLDQIDGGAVNFTGATVNYNEQYSINLKGNGAGDGKGNILFADKVNNVSSVTADNANLLLGSYDGHHANFGVKLTSLTLNDSLLKLNYDAYQSLKLSNLVSSGNSFLSFSANFNQGLSDSIDTAATEGNIGIYNIHFDGYGNVGDRITIFDNANMTINNLDGYTKIYNNLTYKFSQEDNQLVVASKTLERQKSLVEENEILDAQETEIEGAAEGVLNNNGITTIVDSNFHDNTNFDDGGVINNSGTLSITNTNFDGNSTQGLGGAIYSSNGLILTADGKDVLFNRNTDKNGANDVYIAGGNLNIGLFNDGKMTFSSGISGNEGYNIDVNGGGELNIDGVVDKAGNVSVANSTVNLGENGSLDSASLTLENSSLKLAKESAINSKDINLHDASIDIANGTIGTLNVTNYMVSGNSLFTLDVDTSVNLSDILNISGDVTGTTNLILNMLSSEKQTADIVFANTPNDNADTSGQFVISRLIGNPYVYDITVKYDEENKKWLFPLKEVPEPDPDIPENPDDPTPPKPIVRPVAPEVIAGAGLHEAAIEQTRSLVRNVRNKVADGRLYCPGCGLYDYNWNGNKLRNVWVLAQGESATIDKPVKADADIWGVEAGFDVQNDIHNTLGVFASYRKGEYDLSGKADKLRSNIGSEIDIDSYLAGLYYRYDKNMNWLFATVYGGVQQADAKTDDKIAKFDTDGIEFGAGIEAGHTFALSNDLTLDPSLGLYYTQINFDDAKDNVGKEYDWKDIKHLEAELGAKLEKQIDYAKIYVKPSVIQTITSGDSVKITGLNKLGTYDDATLGRIELGGRYGFTDALSAYGWVNYTFGADYDATAFGAGVSYSW